MVSDMAKCRVFTITLTSGAKKWLKSMTPGSITSWQQLSTSFLQQFQATKQFAIPLAHLGNVKQKNGESLKSYLNHFIIELAHVRWALDAGILAHLTNGVLSETPLWDELQQKECRNVGEFYRKANKFLKLENSKEASNKAQGVFTSKKNDQRQVFASNKSK